MIPDKFPKYAYLLRQGCPAPDLYGCIKICVAGPQNGFQAESVQTRQSPLPQFPGKAAQDFLQMYPEAV